jgi:hypothetical protein
MSAQMPPVTPVDGPISKVKRAYENIADLDTRIAAFLTDTEYVTTLQAHLQDGTIIFSHGRTRAADDIAVRIGEVIHNLRSSLDQLYFALVTASFMTTKNRLLTTSEERTVQFPVCRDAKDYRAFRKGKIEGWVPDAALPMFDGVQPCHNPPADDYFTQVITDLNNRDKHRLLVLAWVKLDAPTVIFDRVKAQLKAGEPIPLNSEVYRQRASDVVFLKLGTHQNKPVLPCLIELTDAVERTIELFKPFI